MTSGLELAGDMASGALLAGAVEPATGKDEGSAHDGGAHGTCANCGTELVGAYCYACGQNSHIHRTLKGFGHDLLHGVFHFEGKIWNTLPLLFFKPGELTRRYIHGERAKFVSPIAGFLFCVFLMFAVVGGLAGDMHLGSDRSTTTDEVGNVNINLSSPQALQKEIDETAAQIAALKTKIRAEDKADRETSALEQQKDDLEEKADVLDKAARFVPGVKPRKSESHDTGIHTGWAALDHGLAKANENPNLFFYRLQSSAYKYSWALIPISTPLVWLLFFWKRQYKVYDHVVFVTFSLTFMMLLVTLMVVLGAVGVGKGFIAIGMMLVPPLHMYRQLRGAYLIGRFSALVRTLLLISMSGIALSLYMVLLLAMGVFH